jgi:hypothetical protein
MIGNNPPDWVVVVRLDVIGDAGGDDFAFC